MTTDTIPGVITTPDAVTTISTGKTEIDKKLGGGIPVGSLTLIEGQSDSGKSVLSQHLVYGALQSKIGVVYYTTENTVKSLLTQMESLSLDVTDNFLLDRLRVYPLRISLNEMDPGSVFTRLYRHIDTLPGDFKVIIIDSITNIMTHSDQSVILDFFRACKELCDQGKSIFMVVHSYAFDEEMLIRVRSMCDSHLKLRLEEVGEKLVKIMEVSKVRNADRSTGNIVTFEVESNMGMRIIPLNKAKV